MRIVADVAAVFRVDPKTVVRCAREGRIAGIRTPGGRLIRYRESDVRAALEVSVRMPESAGQELDGIAVLAVSA
ncbi:helix-turn-helix domain-containing protein [Sphaerisporangium sp. NPDC004334]